MTVASLAEICRVHELIADRGNGTTAIDKRPVEGAVRVKPFGIFGDVQVDRKYHGGLWKAVYAYASEDAAYFEDLLGRPVSPGTFGENLRTQGIDVNAAIIGERWQIGAKVVVEVTTPRTPCGTFARRMGDRAWVKKFDDAKRPGTYLRVIKSGDIQRGDSIEVLSRPAHGVAIRDWFARHDAETAAILRDAAAQGLSLDPEIERDIKKILGL